MTKKPNAALMILSGKAEGGDPSPVKAGKKSTKSTGAKKTRVINMGEGKPPIKITKPGALKVKAQKAGESTKEFASSHTKGISTTAKQSRAALGLMSMGSKKK
jgi:hypothetical protein